MCAWKTKRNKPRKKRMSVLTIVLWVLLVVVVLGGLNYGTIAVFGSEKGDFVSKLCHAMKKGSEEGKQDCGRVVHGVLGLCSVALLGAAIAHSSATSRS